MKTYQHLWSMTAIISTLLVCNMGVQLVKAQQSPQTPQVVTAHEFRLVNDQNQTMATMALGGDGGPQISLFDAGQKKRVELKVDGYRVPTITLLGASGTTRLKLTQNDYKGDPDAPQVQLYDAQEKLLGTLGINPNSKSELNLADLGGHAAVLKSDSFFFYSPNNSVSTALFPYSAKTPGLAFANGEGRYIWTAPPKTESKRK